MTNFQKMLEEVRADVRNRNLKTVAQYNEFLKDNGHDVEVKLTKDNWGNDECVSVIGKDGGYYVQASINDEQPESLVWKINNTLQYFDIDVREF